jgi:hypothetical protein
MVGRAWIVAVASLSLLGACSSQQAPSEAGAADVDAGKDAGGVVVDVSDFVSDAAICELTAHLLTREAAPGDCTFDLDQAAPYPDQVRVRSGTTIIPRDDIEGWVYQPGFAAIELRGSFCQMVRDGTIGSLDMLFGCPPGLPVP